MDKLTIIIQRASWVGLVVLGLLVNWAITGFAENVPGAGKSVAEIPSDVGRWMTTWKALPETVQEVGEEHGPVAAVIYGSAKGVVKLTEVTAKEAWRQAVNEDRWGEEKWHGRSDGLVLRYEF